jgi:hypothetical protein
VTNDFHVVALIESLFSILSVCVFVGKSSINKLNELNQAYLHKLFTNGDKVYVFRFLRLVLHCC